MSTGPADQAQLIALSRDGTPIAYWKHGQGPPLLLVHGSTSDHSRWATLVELLEPHFTVSLMDRRGRGHSGDSSVHSIEHEAADVAAVVDALVAEHGVPVTVFGHSYGGLCSLEATLLTPGVGRLVLYEAPAHEPSAPTDVVDRIENLINDGHAESALEMVFREVVGLPDEEIEVTRAQPTWPVRVANAPTFIRELRSVVAYRFDPARFDTLEIPTLILVGGDSAPRWGASAEKISAALPAAQVRVLTGHQHMALDTAPSLVAEVLLAVLGPEARR